jgi:hypothetical protein
VSRACNACGRWRVAPDRKNNAPALSDLDIAA